MCFKNIYHLLSTHTELGVLLNGVDFIKPHFTDKERNRSLERLRNLQVNEWWSQPDSKINTLSSISHCHTVQNLLVMLGNGPCQEQTQTQLYLAHLFLLTRSLGIKL